VNIYGGCIGFLDRDFIVILIEIFLSCNNVAIKDKEDNIESSRTNAWVTLLVLINSPSVLTPACAYKKASTSSFFPLWFLPRPATTLLGIEIYIS
jgi:hypothetical protein